MRYPPSPGTCTRSRRCGLPALLRKADRRHHFKRADARLPSLRSVADHIASARRAAAALTKYPPYPGTCTHSRRCGLPALLRKADRRHHFKRADARLPPLCSVADHIASARRAAAALTKYPPYPGTCTHSRRCGLPALLRKADRRHHFKRADARLPSLRSVADHIAQARRTAAIFTKYPPYPGTYTRSRRCGPSGPGGCPPAAGRRPPPSAQCPPASPGSAAGSPGSWW